MQAVARAVEEGFMARSADTMKVGLYARVSTQEQQTLTLQRDAMAAYATQRGWSIVTIVEEVGSGGHARRQREELLRAARRRMIDAILVWR
jgi:putative DNA-invertase from lambdoid prophage Rac